MFSPTQAMFTRIRLHCESVLIRVRLILTFTLKEKQSSVLRSVTQSGYNLEHNNRMEDGMWVNIHQAGGVIDVRKCDVRQEV